MTMGKYGKIIIALFIAIGASVAFLSLGPNPLSAQQSNVQEPQERPIALADFFKERDIKTLIFSNDRRGCAMKSSFFYVASNLYEQGVSVEEASGFKVAEPLFAEIYDTIKEEGLEQATIDNLKDFEACMENAPKDPNPEIEYEQQQKFEPCRKLNAIVIDTLDSIDKRQKADTVINRHSRENLDLSETVYKNVPDPAALFIGKLYEANQKEGRQGAASMAMALTLGCVN